MEDENAAGAVAPAGRLEARAADDEIYPAVTVYVSGRQRLSVGLEGPSGSAG